MSKDTDVITSASVREKSFRGTFAFLYTSLKPALKGNRRFRFNAIKR